jgi:predicted ATPase
LFLAEAITLQGWALTQQDHSDQGMVQMRDGLSAWRATGAELLTPLFFGLLADGYKKYGSIMEAYRSRAEALASA